MIGLIRKAWEYLRYLRVYVGLEIRYAWKKITGRA